jgi:L-rhamnose mutarotase
MVKGEQPRPREAVMERAFFTIELWPGQEQEYDRRHDEIWPEMTAALKASGFANYTLFRRGTSVFAYVECHPDRATAFATMAATEVDRRWQASMSGIIAKITDDDGNPLWADEVWHLDE